MRKKNFRSIVAIVYYFTLCSSSNAYTLDKALHKALKHNSEIKLEESRLNQVKATKGEAISDFLPDISATYQRGRQKNDAIGLDRGFLDKMNDQDVKQLNFTQPIFTGFSGYNNLKEVNSNIQSAEEYLKSRKLEVLLQATESYLNLFKARKLVDLKKNEEKDSKELLKLIKGRNRSGQVGGSEVIKYQTFVTTAASDTLTAKKDLFKAEEEYRRIFGKIDRGLFLPIINEKKSLEREKDLINLALSRNPTLKTYLFKIQAARFAKNKSKGKFSPTFEIAASASEQQNVTYLNNRNLRSESVYLNVRVPLFQKGIEYSGLDKANKNLSFAKREYQTNKENIIRDVKQSRREVRFYKELIKSQENLINLTKRRIANIKQQVKIGEGDVIDLLESKLELSKISIQQLSNKSDYILSYYKLLMLTGKFRA